jgi:hypothetical protein
MKVYSISPCEYFLSSLSLVLTQVFLWYTTKCYKSKIKEMFYCSLWESETQYKNFEIIIKLYFFTSQTMNVEIGTEAALFPEYIKGIFFVVQE